MPQWFLGAIIVGGAAVMAWHLLQCAWWVIEAAWNMRSKSCSAEDHS